MTSTSFNRRDFSVRLAAFFSALGVAGPVFAAPLAGRDEVSHTEEAIRQEVIFKASRTRVYEALTDAKQFAEVVQLSAAGMSLGNAPTEISREVGGSFSLFGGHILGRHIELAPNTRIVQAWRVANWSESTR